MAQDLAERLAQLPGLNTGQLRVLWQQVFASPLPFHAQKDLVVRCLAYRLQEQAHGGLRSTVRRQLLKLAQDIESGTALVLLDTPRIKPGTRLIRSWQGRTHEVTAIEGGFRYQDQRYASLSEIARLITGTRWSGPVFFGLKRPSSSARAPRHGRGS
jgi:hypothetical protein